MTDKRPNAVFNIGSQQGNISNVAGDMTVYGDQHYLAVDTASTAREVAILRQWLNSTRLDPAVRAQAVECLDKADRELQQPEPSADNVARPIERLTALLKDTGQLAEAGANVVGPLQRIASFLGAAGSAILALLV